MFMDDKDWLDERLASGVYIPDDGFTGRVVNRLPKIYSREAKLRLRILFTAALLAVCLAALQIVPLVREIEMVGGQYSLAQMMNSGLSYLQKPTFVLGVAATILVSTLASIPLLRRWA